MLDEWFESEVQPRMSGRAFLVRYADDFVIGFEHEEDARRVLAVLPKRFERFGLKLHPEKTRLVEFKPSPDRNRKPKEDNDNNDPNSHPKAQRGHRGSSTSSGSPITGATPAKENPSSNAAPRATGSPGHSKPCATGCATTGMNR